MGCGSGGVRVAHRQAGAGRGQQHVSFFTSRETCQESETGEGAGDKHKSRAAAKHLNVPLDIHFRNFIFILINPLNYLE